LNPNLADYKRLVAMDIPGIDVRNVITGSLTGFYGVKETSEGSHESTPPPVVIAIHVDGYMVHGAACYTGENREGIERKWEMAEITGCYTTRPMSWVPAAGEGAPTGGTSVGNVNTQRA
jgi:hypothetical protein